MIKTKDKIIKLDTLEPGPSQNRIHDENSVLTYTQKKRKLPFLSFILLSVMSLSVVAGVIFLKNSKDVRSEAANPGSTLILSPATKSGNVGDTLTIDIILNTNVDTVSAVDLHLIYDPIAIQVSTFNPASILPIILSPVSINNGNMNVTLGSTPTTPFIGTSVLGSITIKILKTGTSTIKFSSNTAVAALKKTTNTLAATTESIITGISSSSISEPTITSAPTNTVTTTLKPSAAPTSTKKIIIDSTPQNTPVKNFFTSIKKTFKPWQLSSTTVNKKINKSEKSSNYIESNREELNTTNEEKTPELTLQEPKQSTGIIPFIQNLFQVLKNFFSLKK